MTYGGGTEMRDGVAVGLSVPSSAFTVTNPATCTTGVNGAKVAASYAVPSFTSGFGFPSITANVSACYPL